MTTVTTLPRGRALTRPDLDTMPDDGHRYELIDGSLVVTPSPSRRHQQAVRDIAVTLVRACPADLELLFAPFDVVLARDTVLQPDLLVARRRDFTEQELPGPPMLAVEVLSPSTRRIDLTLKRDRYAAAGCTSYWVVDPEVPSLTAWDLREGEYVEVAHVVGAAEFIASTPFGVTISPGGLMS